MNTSGFEFRLGELLIGFGLATKEQIHMALDIATTSPVPLGKILVLNASLPEHLLRGAIDAQWMIRDQLLDLGKAQHAIHIMRRKQWSFSDALVSLSVDAHATRGGRLGELLKDASLVTPDDLNKSLDIANHTGFPIGQILLAQDKISGYKLRLGLALQRELRANREERQRVVERLKNAATIGEPICLPTVTLGPPPLRLIS
ncbi:MAG: hypothetical protein K2X93_07345 [Candidatus Obscuribacterales bacterium]|nr:hypothetical protein [Candidatus Obscuribacterales bacterium]